MADTGDLPKWKLRYEQKNTESITYDSIYVTWIRTPNRQIVNY